jgi:hypothetical protein
MSSLRFAAISAAALAVGLGTVPAHAHLTSNHIIANALVNNALISNALLEFAGNALPASPALTDLNGVAVEDVTLPSAED